MHSKQKNMKNLIIISLMILATQSKGQLEIRTFDINVVKENLIENRIFESFYNNQKDMLMNKGVSLLNSYEKKHRKIIKLFERGCYTIYETERMRIELAKSQELILDYENRMIETLEHYEESFTKYKDKLVIKNLSDYYKKHPEIPMVQSTKINYVYEEAKESDVTDEIVEMMNSRSKNLIETNIYNFFVEIICEEI